MMKAATGNHVASSKVSANLSRVDHGSDTRKKLKTLQSTGEAGYYRPYALWPVTLASCKSGSQRVALPAPVPVRAMSRVMSHNSTHN